MKKYGITIIGILFLIYGGIRLWVSSVLLLQTFGLINIADLQAALIDIGDFMQSRQDNSVVPFSVVVYLSYLWVMGALLVTGAIGCLKRQSFGHISLSVFLVLYVLLFVNFQTINPKVIHLVVCATLLGLYLWLRKKEFSPDSIKGE
jgi:hypothetical protein|tara:strand:+ start:59 stop:499 length:441 start_codon:yes stop_codon:yes gene_type:complete